ncbi:lysophospholipid acyltransferase family protein [Geovibrio thiophilus]|uniref:lysophospholipid acyltransferase family protein n=1 Tax=Geovibrio thiophilus TaxID=139438 RepID=UPI0013E40599|nr:lysophospholipid acyltransferase family protein [Geovibrio thiophilus]
MIKFFYLLLGGRSLGFLRRTGSFLGFVFWYLLPARRKIAIKNAEIVGAPDPVKCARESFRHTFMSYMEAFYIGRVDEKFLEKYIKIICRCEKPDPITGEIIVSAHFGCWELAAPSLAVISPLRIGLLARKIKDPKIDEFVKGRRDFSDKLIYLHHRDCAEEISRLIASNAHIAALLDHASTEKDSIFIPFFGIKTTFNKGLPLIAVRRNIPIRPAFMKRTDEGAEMIFLEQILPDPNLKPKDRINDVAIKINKAFEEIISKNPEQWYLLHKRFKKTEDENGKVSRRFY